MWQLILAEKKAWKLKRLGYNINLIFWNKGFPGGSVVKRRPAMQETWVRSLGREDPLGKEMATHSSTLAWKIPWTEEPGRLQSMGSQRLGQDWVTELNWSYSSEDWKSRIKVTTRLVSGKTFLVCRWLSSGSSHDLGSVHILRSRETKREGTLVSLLLIRTLFLAIRVLPLQLIKYLFSSRSEVAQSCVIPCDPMDCSLPGSSTRGIFLARVLEWVAISFCGGSSWPGDRTHFSSVQFIHSVVSDSLQLHGLKSCLLHCRQTLYPLSHQGSPIFIR